MIVNLKQYIYSNTVKKQQTMRKLKAMQIFLFIVLIFISNGQTTTSSLNQIMNTMKTTVYKEIYHKPINISIGQELSIVLPSFDSFYTPNTVEFRHLSDQQYARALNQLETIDIDNTNNADFDTQKNSQPNNSQQKTSQQIGTPVSSTDLPIKCTHIPPVAKVYQTISKIGDQTGYNSNNLQTKLYMHVTSRQLLYILNTQNMLLSAYYYNDINIKFLSSFQLPNNKDSHDSQGAQTHYSITMTLNAKQSELYIFAPHGIWVIQTKTFLTNIKQLSSISGLDINDSNGLDKAIKGTGSYFVGMKKMGKVFIIPQPSSNQRAIFTEVTNFNDEHIFPQDVAVFSSYLFILDVYKGVYVYKISADFRAKELFKIELENYGGNYKIHIYQANTLFVNFNDFDGSKVVEINVDLQNQKAELVRYFKNDDYISFIQTYNVLTSSTGFYLNEISEGQSIDLKQVRNSAETLLFLVSNFQQIQIFPFNIDPRTINMFYNGVKIYYPKVKEVYHIFGDRFLIVTQDTIDYVKISIEKPQVTCMIGKKYNEDYKVEPDHLKIIVRSNVSTCEFRNKLFRHKVFYNENCQLITQYLVHLNDPEKSSLRKVITYGIVLLVLAAFILGLFCLIQWRKQKLVVLSRLKDEIMRFRNRHRRMQPFVQEQVPQRKQVQMQVPKDIEYIPNDEDN